MANQIDWFTGDGTTTTFVLEDTPVGEIGVYWNGLIQPPDTFTLLGNNVTTTFVPEGGSDPDTVAVAYVYTPISPNPPSPGGGGAGGVGPLINVSEVVNDPDFAQSFMVLRSLGNWNKGTWLSNLTEIPTYGVIEVGAPREIDMIPEADVIKGAITIWTSSILYGTSDLPIPGRSSDLIVWHGIQWRILQDSVWSDFGYWRAVATRLPAA